MCIINEPAKVAKTRIFVAPDQLGQRQVTVYANNVLTDSDNNVMVLPVPYPKHLKFIDLSAYKDIFDDLDSSFTEKYLSFSNHVPQSRELLVAFDVGSYRVTVVPDCSRLDDIDPTEFGTLQSHIKSILNKHYPYCGFIVCKLRPGLEVKYHPLAYSHPIMPNKKLFVPTRHQHNHEVGSGMFVIGQHASEEETESDWDHEIYSFNTAHDAGNCPLVDKGIYLNKGKLDFPLCSIKSFNKYKIEGVYPNTDIYLTMVQ